MKSKWTVIALSWLLLAGLLAVGLQFLFPPRLTDARLEEILQCLDHAQTIKMPVDSDICLVVRKGEPAFDECIAILKQVILRSPNGWHWGGPVIDVLILDEGDVECLKVGYTWHLVIDGMSFDYAGTKPLLTLIEDAVSQRHFYYPSGKRKAKGMFERGKKTGCWTFYYESGEKMSEGPFVADEKDGVWLTWDKAGNVIAKEEYKKGELVEKHENANP